jgi:energy-coupling factor transport system substrate-specific component
MIRYATRDWILIAAVSAVIGVFFTFLDSLYSSLSNLLGSAMDLTFGVYALLPLYLCRKPGSALAGSLFAAVINILTGSPYGIHIIVAGLLQSLGAEAGFGVGRYKRYGILQFVIASLFITLFVSLRDYFAFGLGQLPFPLLLLTLGLRILSVSLASFLICLAIGLALRKAGLVKYAAEP